MNRLLDGGRRHVELTRKLTQRRPIRPDAGGGASPRQDPGQPAGGTPGAGISLKVQGPFFRIDVNSNEKVIYDLTGWVKRGIFT